MKNFILILFTTVCFSQSDVPSEYWLDDKSFEDTVIGSAFDDSESETILVEFWAEFNAENCFADWNKIENATYYRVNNTEYVWHLLLYCLKMEKNKPCLKLA